MDTDRLIEALAADSETRAKPVSWMLALALALAAPVSTAVFAMQFGPRDDWRAAMRNPFFDLKFVVMIALAVAAAVLVLRLARPGAPVRRISWLLGIPAGLLGIGVATDLMMPQQSAWSTRMMGSNSMICLTVIPLLSLPLLAAALVALRHGAATRPALAGAAAGLMSAALAAVLYAAHCFDDSPLFVITWYSLAIGAVTALGALIGARVLRF
ncbi:MAG: NrsF family protein [Pseudomonadota bacterium]|jgi:hypothetical protein